MIERIKLDLWDVLVVFFTGVLVLINGLVITCYYLSTKQVLCYINGIPSIILTFSAFTIPFAVGMVFEMITIYYSKCAMRIFKRKKYFENWQIDIDKRIEEAKEYIPENRKSYELFYYCRSYNRQFGSDPLTNAFSCKFGAYRNLSLLLLLNSLYMLFIAFNNEMIREFGNMILSLSLGIILALLAYGAAERSAVFHYHQNNTVFTNFIVLNDCKNVDRKRA